MQAEEVEYRYRVATGKYEDDLEAGSSKRFKKDEYFSDEEEVAEIEEVADAEEGDDTIVDSK